MVGLMHKERIQTLITFLETETKFLTQFWYYGSILTGSPPKSSNEGPVFTGGCGCAIGCFPLLFGHFQYKDEYVVSSTVEAYPVNRFMLADFLGISVETAADIFMRQPKDTPVFKVIQDLKELINE